MDYLDPKKKRQKKNHLLTMYALLGIAIAIATVVVVYLVQGYSIDRKTGEVIQNGLVYVDANPAPADVYLNGEQQNGRTDLRLVIPEGKYEIELKRDGYRPWKRNFSLDGGTLRRLTYARLLPNELTSTQAFTLEKQPSVISQSSDKRWLAIKNAENPLQFNIIDLNRAELRVDTLQLAPDLFDTTKVGTWKIIEWADDNKTFLASFSSDSFVDYFLIDREDSTKVKKIKSIFPDISFTTARLRAVKNDLLYLYDAKSQKVYAANTKDGSTKLVLEKVISYRPHGSNAFAYITEDEESEDSVLAKLRVGEKDYMLRTIAKADRYLLDISQLESAYVVAVSSPVENRVLVYNDPIKAIDQNDFSEVPVPTTVLKIDAPEELRMSTDSSTVAARSDQKFAVHEFDADRSYSFILEQPIDETTETMRWLDGQHILVSAAGKQIIMDFDGSNLYELFTAKPEFGTYIDPKQEFLYSFTSNEDGTFSANQTSLRTVADQ